MSGVEASNEITSSVLQLEEHLSRPQAADASCRKSKKGDLVCRVLWTTEDGALLLSQGSKVKWTREESLANIVALEMIDLPLSDAEGSIEKQLKNKHGEFPRDGGGSSLSHAFMCIRSRWKPIV